MKVADDLHRYLTTSTLPIYGGDVRRSLTVLGQLFDLQTKQLNEQSKESEADQRFAEALKFTQVCIWGWGGGHMTRGAEPIFQHIGAIIDFLMSTDNAAAWHDLLMVSARRGGVAKVGGAYRSCLQHDRMVQLSELMQLVEENASFLARFMVSDNTTRLNFTNYGETDPQGCSL